MKKTKLPKKILMPVRVKRAKKKLEELCHNFVKDRDAIQGSYPRSGYCCSCGKYVSGSDYQAGHYEPSGASGATLRYHPHNIHGQGGFCCNINRNHQQKMGNAYTMYMIRKYGIERVHEIRNLKNKTIKADIWFYEKMIELYEKGDEKSIIEYLEN